MRGFCCTFGRTPLAIAYLSPARQAEGLAGGPDLNRRILLLVGGFRLLVAAALLLTALVVTDNGLLGLRLPQLFTAVTTGYFAAALAITLLMQQFPGQTPHLTWLQLTVDIVSIALLVYASGGVGTGIEGLLVVFVAASGMTLTPRNGYFAAAIAALAILLVQTLSVTSGVAAASSFVPAGALGAIMMAVLVAIQPLLRRISEAEKLARQQGIDLANLAQLNEYIIQTLREAIVVVDERDTIRLINQAALETLGTPHPRDGMHLADVSAPVHELLRGWRAGNTDLARGIPSFVAADGATVINTHFAPLGSGASNGPVLMFLEDASLLAEKVQQSKLAALGRLSASIAHEIRNPVGALSHAGQLLRESTRIDEQDRRLLEIIQTNSRRVSEIVDNILQLSRKDTVRPRQLELGQWSRDFVREFETTLELFEGQLSVLSGEEVTVFMDPGHLHQLVWNLCENAMKYASETAGAIAVELSYGRLPNSHRPFMEIADHGPGIPPDMQDSIFEPFATGRAGGTGLGLYICRELCERNRATLRYRPRESGGSIFQIVFADPGRWDASG